MLGILLYVKVNSSRKATPPSQIGQPFYLPEHRHGGAPALLQLLPTLFLEPPLVRVVAGLHLAATTPALVFAVDGLAIAGIAIAVRPKQALALAGARPRDKVPAHRITSFLRA